MNIVRIRNKCVVLTTYSVKRWLKNGTLEMAYWTAENVFQILDLNYTTEYFKIKLCQDLKSI